MLDSGELDSEEALSLLLKEFGISVEEYKEISVEEVTQEQKEAFKRAVEKKCSELDLESTLNRLSDFEEKLLYSIKVFDTRIELLSFMKERYRINEKKIREEMRKRTVEEKHDDESDEVKHSSVAVSHAAAFFSKVEKQEEMTSYEKLQKWAEEVGIQDWWKYLNHDEIVDLLKETGEKAIRRPVFEKYMELLLSRQKEDQALSERIAKVSVADVAASAAPLSPRIASGMLLSGPR